MKTVQEFIDANRHLPNFFEGKMVLAYCSAMKDLELAERDQNHSYQVESAQKKLAIQSDIEKFMEIVGGYSRWNIAEKLHRCQLDIEKAKHQSRNVLKKTIRDHPDISPDNAEKMEIVQEAFAKRDTIIMRLKPTVIKLAKKLNEAEEILKKYGSEAVIE